MICEFKQQNFTKLHPFTKFPSICIQVIFLRPCVYQNIQKTADVVVTRPKIGILHPLQDLEIEEGDVAEFVIETSRPVKIDFYLDEEKLKHNPGEIEIETEQDGTIHRLFMFNTTEADSGLIRAFAIGQKEFISEALLDVLRKLLKF